jgi:hypothetical protein
MKYMIWVEVEKEPTNETEDYDGPRGAEVAREIEVRIVGRDLDTGWTVKGVTA